LSNGLSRPVGDDSDEQRMPAQRLSQAKFDVGISLTQPDVCLRQIAADVNTGREKVRQQHDPVRALRNAAGSAAIDVGLGQLQKTRLDDGERTLNPQRIDDVMQVGVGLRFPAAVRDEEDGGVHRMKPRRGDGIKPRMERSGIRGKAPTVN
jgi:hypothetical protein